MKLRLAPRGRRSPVPLRRRAGRMRGSSGRGALVLDASLAARAAELRYLDEDEPGLTRLRVGRSFRYFDEKSARVTDTTTLARIRALAIPPAWTQVWICRTEDGHIQATGRDARGRKQYRYHARWRSVRDEAKYELILAFGSALPGLRERIERDLRAASLTRDKVIATVLRIMELTCIRVGNDCYADANGSFGLTTLLDRHVRIAHGMVTFAFVGKSGKLHQATVRDARLASIVKRCRDVPGQRLFQWVDEQGARHPVTSTDVNAYIREATGGPYTAKMIRTWSATVSAAGLLHAAEPGATVRATKRVIGSCLGAVAAQLGNTPAICRKSYIHPAIVEAYADGTFHTAMRGCLSAAKRRTSARLSPEELALLVFFERRERSEGPRLAIRTRGLLRTHVTE